MSVHLRNSLIRKLDEGFKIFFIGNKIITFTQMKSSELMRILKKDGWFEIRQSGSHVLMKHPTKEGTIPVPFHASKEVKKGLLNAILKQAKIETNKG